MKKRTIKKKRRLSWHSLGFKHERLCEKLATYLEGKKNLAPGSGLVPWRSHSEKTSGAPTTYLW